MPQLILWTALPNGIAHPADRPGPHLRLSVRVSPRLTPAGAHATLADFPDFATWAEKPWRFDIRLGSLAPITGLRPENQLDPDLWHALFLAPKPIGVRERKTHDYSARFVRSFPAARIHEYLRRTYRATGLAHPSDLPSNGWLLGRNREKNPDHFAAIAPDAEHRKAAQSLLAQHSEGRSVSPAYHQTHTADEAAAVDFLQAELFHQFKGRPYATKPHPPSFDFHRALAALAGYDPLLRRLGLVFDLLVPLPAGLPAHFPVRIAPSIPLHDGNDARLAPATRCRLDAAAERFDAEPGPKARLVAGHLDFSSEDFSLAQVDLDGAALKLPNFVANLQKRSGSGACFGTPETSGVPALRSGGLAVLLNERAADFVRTIQSGANFDTVLADTDNRTALADLAQPAPLAFHAEDLVRGFRVDVLDVSANRWYSLCQRLGTYRCGPALDPVAGIQPDEGTVTTAVVTDSAAPDTSDLFLHEALFHWDGWSLAVPRPGSTILKPVPHSPTNNVGTVAPTADNELGLNVAFAPVPKTLPALRYGRRYRLRARAVDLAGNSRLLAEDNDPTGASADVPYLRFEPVPAPALAMGDLPHPGESVERLVIRNWSAAPTPATTEVAARQVVAPRASVQTAELHGCIAGAAPDGAPSWYEILATRDKAQLAETPTPEKPASVPPPAEAPYLPDPLSRGAAIVGLPGADAPVALPVEFTGQWPHAATFGLRLEEGPLGHTWDAALRVLVVRLPKAARLTLRLSSHLPADGSLDQLGVWHWLCEGTPEAWIAKLRALAEQGRHWMLTPWRELTLVHAVQQPLAAPTVDQPRPVREAGTTYSKLTGALSLSAASTDKVDLRAEWREYVPKPTDPEGHEVLVRTADVASIPISDPARDRLALAVQHEFGDTKHRRVGYWATATSRFREYFEFVPPGSPEPDPATLLDFTNPPRTAVRPQPDFALDIPSSARPAAVEIDYIVPTFGWSQDTAPDTTHRHRRGRGLRVYLKGDWFSSGEGELLGVVLAHGPQIKPGDGLATEELEAVGQVGAPLIPESLRALVTRWGIDPLWVSNPTHQVPTVDHFPDATVRRVGLRLAENPAIPAGQPAWGVAVAGHPVHWDRSLDRWYCDLTVDAGPSYFPFVRLALARFQPCSVADVELSRVATADCVQTVPDRLFTVAHVAGDPTRIQVTVSGVAPRANLGVVCPNRLVARVEVRQTSDAETVWVPVVGSARVLAEMQVTKTATVWSAELALPQPRASQPYRIVVEEYEILAADRGRGLNPSALGSEAFMVAAAHGISSTGRTAVWPRLVYADTVEL